MVTLISCKVKNRRNWQNLGGDLPTDWSTNEGIGAVRSQGPGCNLGSPCPLIVPDPFLPGVISPGEISPFCLKGRGFPFVGKGLFFCPERRESFGDIWNLWVNRGVKTGFFFVENPRGVNPGQVGV